MQESTKFNGKRNKGTGAEVTILHVRQSKDR